MAHHIYFTLTLTYASGFFVTQSNWSEVTRPCNLARLENKWSLSKAVFKPQDIFSAMQTGRPH